MRLKGGFYKYEKYGSLSINELKVAKFLKSFSQNLMSSCYNSHRTNFSHNNVH